MFKIQGSLGGPSVANAKPPLLQTYSAPSGPIAAPFGEPPKGIEGPATNWPGLAGSGLKRSRSPDLTSTARSEPSSSQTGPSGYCSPEAITTKSDCWRGDMSSNLVSSGVFPL